MRVVFQVFNCDKRGEKKKREEKKDMRGIVIAIDE
jgi:hypothetical protein